MAKLKKKTKAEELQEAVAEAVGAGRELHLESVDFSDPNRPKTCLEVDFPILPINHVAAIEGNAGKPIYQMSKWWARRRSSVFRAMLIAAATKAPEDQGEAAKTVWDAYYGNHQKNEAFRKLKVADIFMGGGTTIVEGARLGMRMYGNDLNPVAWLVVKNELAQVDPKEVQKLLDAIEAEVKPQIMPFYACDCPRGHKGKWTQKATGKVMGADFDPLRLTPEQRPEYDYDGPQILHVFWAKHGPCPASECQHRTPIMSSPVVAVKQLTVKAWTGKECQSCGKKFDIEQKDARMAPAAMLVVADSETPFAVMDDKGNYSCPHCGHERQDEKAASGGQSSSLGKAKNKKVDLTLLIHPDWIKGTPSRDVEGQVLGGSITDSPESTAAWNEVRASSLSHIEIRGEVPKTLNGIEDGFSTERGTVPKQSTFVCMAPTCGGHFNVLESVQRFGKSAPVAAFAVQGFCPRCSEEGRPYSGRFFSVPNPSQMNQAASEWGVRSESDLSEYFPKSRLFTYKDGNDSKLYIQPSHGFTHWYMMFNPRQRLVLSQLLRSLLNAEPSIGWNVREFVLGAFQLYLRNQNMFCFWHRSHDHFAPALSNNNFHPKDVAIEIGTFTPVGYGPWSSTVKVLEEGVQWAINPWEIVSNDDLQAAQSIDNLSGRGTKVFTK